jgi:hypothetical protein
VNDAGRARQPNDRRTSRPLFSDSKLSGGAAIRSGDGELVGWLRHHAIVARMGVRGVARRIMQLWLLLPVTQEERHYAHGGCRESKVWPRVLEHSHPRYYRYTIYL